MDPNTQQSQQPITSQPLVQQVPQTTSIKSPLPKILLSILGVIVVLGLIGGAYYLGTQKNISNVALQQTISAYPTSVVTVIPTNSVTPTPNETANWQTYTNPTYYFSFKYPSAWTEWNSQDNYGIRTEIISVNAPDKSGQLLRVYKLENPNNLTSVEFIKQLPAYEGGGFVKPLQNQPPYFSNMDAVETNGFGGGGNTGNAAYIHDKQGDILLLFTSDLDNSTTNTIFSTFTLSQ